MEEKERQRACTGDCFVNTELECLPCFFRQVYRSLSYAGMNGDTGRSIARRAVRIVEEAPLDQAPARISTLLHRLVREATNTDPYKQIKDEYTQIALNLLPSARKMANRSTPASDAEILEGGVRAAIAGNIIDFGIYDSVDLDRSLKESFLFPLPAQTFQDFVCAVRNARSVLYLCDNAGEIVFDRILIDALRSLGKNVTAVVKGKPVINDATLLDAKAAGLDESASKIIDNGNDGVGTLLELCSESFIEAYKSSELIISKGQANYETLSTSPDNRIFFMFKIKCPVVARWLGKENGDIILMQNQRSACAAGR